ncbi:hypothetical protein A2Y85_06480 [candidate division WOR-3 bacterium RBG_13_43_14]|uniref:Radical SAM protein n=1 Tax=candidate division WOR-3 bacterium RBG_13_43_14 TaxID=1802590 RepID=A0A1F4UAP4_UNCW3|nr:MAG: hypothetical protein A2Y85_06480 [candidate division WOR-3 bacterium RBG_13_43_14]
MKILFFNPTIINKKYVMYEALRGSAFFRRPNYDAMRIAYLLREHDYTYFDERIEDIPKIVPDLIIANVPLNLSDYTAKTVREYWPNHGKIIAFGFFPSIYPHQCHKNYDSVVVGDIANILDRIVQDFQSGALCPQYEALKSKHFRVDRRIESRSGFTPILSQIKTTMGCTCVPASRDYCFEKIMHRELEQWDINEAAEETGRIKRKIIFLRDDDFLHDPDYAVDLLEKTWRYKKRWIIQTGLLFNDNRLLPILREGGVRIIYLKENWLGHNLINDINDRDYRKEKELQIRKIHKNRMIAGVKIRLGFDNETENFYRQLCKFLINIKADFIQVAACMPIPGTSTYTRLNEQNMIHDDLTSFDQWMPVVHSDRATPQALYTWMESLRDRFYSWDSIIMRNIAVARNIGFYNSLFFHLIPNLSYRTNFLEKVGYPP